MADIKCPPATIDDFRFQNTDSQRGENMAKQNEETFACYYYDKFPSASNEEEYLKNVVLTHNNKLTHPSMTDL